MEEKDLSVFDKNVIDLFDLCKEILKTKEKRKLFDRKNPFVTRLERYIKIYNKTEPNEHIGYFEKIYKNNKRFILLGPQRDSWLSESEIIITYGEEANIKTEIKVHLSAIYGTALELRKEIREELEGLPDSSDTTETTFPSKFSLFLYRIFREISESEVETKKLTTHIENLESEFGIRNSNGNDPLSGLFDMTSNMMEQMTGNKISKDKMPGKNDIGQMFNTMLNDPKTKSMIGNVMQGLQNSENIGDMATKLVGALGSGEGMGDLAKSFGGMMNGNNGNSGNSGNNTTAPVQPPTEALLDGGINDEFADF